jgi:hypothetical protein
VNVESGLPIFQSPTAAKSRPHIHSCDRLETHLSACDHETPGQTVVLAAIASGIFPSGTAWNIQPAPSEMPLAIPILASSAVESGSVALSRTWDQKPASLPASAHERVPRSSSLLLRDSQEEPPASAATSCQIRPVRTLAG